MAHDHLSLMGAFLFPDEAKLAQALLESVGIPTYLENEHLIGANWGLANSLGGLRLFVPADRAAETASLLLAGISDDDLNAQAEAAAPPENEREE